MSKVSFTASTSSAASGVWITYVTTGPGPVDPPPAAVGATIPAPRPFPPGPLRWTARRLDRPADAAEVEGVAR